jgi:hypothetical protein
MNTDVTQIFTDVFSIIFPISVIKTITFIFKKQFLITSHDPRTQPPIKWVIIPMDVGTRS